MKGRKVMRKRVLMTIATMAILFAVSACADLQIEQLHGAQFASWRHMGYSLFRGTPNTTTKQDIATAQRQQWWGDPVQVAPLM